MQRTKKRRHVQPDNPEADLLPCRFTIVPKAATPAQLQAWRQLLARPLHPGPKTPHARDNWPKTQNCDLWQQSQPLGKLTDNNTTPAPHTYPPPPRPGAALSYVPARLLPPPPPSPSRLSRLYWRAATA